MFSNAHESLGGLYKSALECKTADLGSTPDSPGWFSLGNS